MSRIGAAIGLRCEYGPEEYVRFLKDLGLDHVEWRRGYLATHPQAPTPEELRELSASYDVTYTLHAPFRGLNIAHFDGYAAGAATDRIERTLRDAAAAEAAGVVVHGGSVPERYPDRVRESGRTHAREGLRRLSGVAADVGVPLCLETQRAKPGIQRFTTTPEELATMLAAVDADPEALKLTLDVGHVKLTGLDPAAFVERFGDRIHVLHLHDNDGTADSHDPMPGFRSVVSDVDAPYNVLEMKSVADVRESVAPADRPR